MPLSLLLFSLPRKSMQVTFLTGSSQNICNKLRQYLQQCLQIAARRWDRAANVTGRPSSEGARDEGAASVGCMASQSWAVAAYSALGPGRAGGS